MRMRLLFRMAVVGWAVWMGGLGLPQPASAVQTDNRGIAVVPTPGEVAIDGKLDDWDRSAQIVICYDVESLLDVYSARVAMMHDQDALYVAIDWTDRTPMGNRHDPRYDAGKGWAGDAVQLRLKTDRITHITAWYYAPRNEPFINVDYGKSLTEPFKGGSRKLYRTEGWELEGQAAMAFARHPDGSGYVQEIRLPWSLITHDGRPHGNFRCGIELLWGEGDFPVHRYADNLDPAANNREFFWTAHNAWGPARLYPEGNLTLPEPAYLKALRAAKPQGPVPIEYTLPHEARVTIAIDDAQGRRVRNLIAALPRSAGAQVEHWDALDDDSNLVEPGTYRWKGIYHTGIHARYTMSFANPGNPTWDTPDGRGAFYGDHTAPHAAAAGGKFVALACPLGESGRHLIGLDLEGQRQWGLNNRHGFVIGTAGGRASLATDGEILWIAQDGPDTIYRVDLATGAYRPWANPESDAQAAASAVPQLDLPIGNLPSDARTSRKVNLAAISVHDGLLAAALALENRIRLLDAHTGAPRIDHAIDNPRAVSFLPDGRLIALSGDQLVRIDANGQITPFSQQRWPDGYGLACDAAGHVYLTVRGTYQNVQVFNADGEHLREIGRRGGRPAHGPFIDDAMRNPAQPAIDALGRLWVTEETFNPKRTSVWSTQGELIRDFVGTTGYAAAGSINPYQPSMALSDNTVYRINLDKGTWRPVYSLGANGHPDQIFRPSAGSRVRFVMRDQATYVFSTVNRNGTILCTINQDDQWRIAAAFGVVQPKNHPEGGPNFEHLLMRSHVGQIFAWADRNADAIVQEEELRFSPPPTVEGKPLAIKSGWWGALPDNDGTITHATASGTHVLQFAITGYTPAGAPIYDPAKPRILPVEVTIAGGMIAGGGDGRVYFNASPFTAIDAEGRRLFTYPSRHVSVHGSHSARAARPGYLIGPSSILGTADFGDEIGEVVSLNGNLGESYLFTHDGLWVQSLFRDVRSGYDVPTEARRGMSMDTITAGGESFGGHFMRTADGRVYLTVGTTDARVIELTGFDTIRRIEGTVTITPEQYAQAQHLQAQADTAAEKLGIARRLSAPPVIDAKPDDWPSIMDVSQPALLIGDEDHRAGRAVLGWDDQHLYIAWRVTAAHPAMRNAGPDPRLLFKSGDCVDLMICDADATPASQRRLLLSNPAGQPHAMLYQPHVPGTPPSERIPFTSPWRTIHFDRVSRLEDVKWATGPVAGGWFVEAAIPWRHLGIDAPAAGAELRADVGILIADTGGTMTIARHYWSNPATNLVNDVPGEAELTPQLWGRLRLEK